ncbi:MAG: GlsB/YeaQ/YmgE family stress response membrane protein [Chthoniobacterales bacterium]
MSITGILVTCIIGLVVGAIAKLLMPGKDPGGCIITMLLGIAGAWLGTFLGRLTFGGENYAAGWIMSLVGAMILLLIYRMIFAKKG